MSFEKIKERYGKHYITKEQLSRFLKLEIITQEQYNEIIQNEVSNE